MIIFTCPKCGGDMVDYVITTFPLRNARKCLKCGATYEQSAPVVIRTEFDPIKEDYHEV